MDGAGDPSHVSSSTGDNSSSVLRPAVSTTSRFFPLAGQGAPATTRTPKVLVPSSSPPDSPVPLTYTPKMGHHPPKNPNPAAGYASSSASSSLFAGRMMKDERLGGPSGGQNLQAPNGNGAASTSASASSSRASSVRRSRDETDDGAPPRKKLNTGPGSSDSIQGVRAGVQAIHVTDISSSSPSPQKPRGKLVRGRGTPDNPPSGSASPLPTPYTLNAPSPSSYVPTPPTGGAGMTFKNQTPLDQIIKSNPNIPVNEIRNQWRMQGGDPNRVIAAIGAPGIMGGIPSPSANGGKMAAYPPGVPVIDLRNVHALPGRAYAPLPTSMNGRPMVPYYSPAPIPQVNRNANGANGAAKARTSTLPSSKGRVPAGARGKAPGGGGSSDESDWDSGSDHDEKADHERVMQALKFFQEATEAQLMEVTTCTQAQAKAIMDLKPFDDEPDLRKKLQRKKGVSPRYFDDYVRMLEGYDSVDSVIERCEAVGRDISDVLAVWATAADVTADSSDAGGASAVDKAGTGGVSLVAVDPEAIKAKANADEAKAEALKSYMSTQPALLAEGVVLKDYQLLGINWLSLLHQKNLSCILADEMGLGKTIQVIAFFCSLKEKGGKGPHLVVVPSSTLENWGREFERFAPGLIVQTYYGTQNDRMYQRSDLQKTLGEWDVCITTYNLAQGNEHDRKFFKKIEWECCVFDEGHVLKNFQSQRYYYLLKIPTRWRLMLTGTPLQNNLQELVSLMNFLLPEYFKDVLESLRAVFKASANSSTSFLSESRVKRASKMMTPFVLRRRKDQVLKDLPKKTERVEWCDLTPMQRDIYEQALMRSKKVLEELPADEAALLAAMEAEKGAEKAKKGRPKKAVMVSSGANSSNILMDLRKASLHPMLFRRLFDDAKINLMARHCLSENEFAESNYDLVVEDMQVMNDAELQWFAKQYRSVKKHALDDSCFLDAGKIERLLPLLAQYKAENKRVLIFSQFTQILEILKVIFDQQGIKFLVLTGQTPVNERQSLVDEFNEDEEISVFLLSTRAGGMGINLTAACVVIIFDQDFNPHNDKQACDRAYRIGQKRDVEVVKFITRGTIEESMLRLAQVKLVLDQAVTAGEDNNEEETATEKTMKASLLSELRKQFEVDSKPVPMDTA